MTNRTLTRDAVAHLAELHQRKLVSLREALLQLKQRKQDRLATTTPVQAVTPADDDGESAHE